MCGQLSTDCSAAVVVLVTVLFALMNFPLFSPTRYSRFSRIPLAYRRQWFVLLLQEFHLAIFQNYYRKMSPPPLADCRTNRLLSSSTSLKRRLNPFAWIIADWNTV